jgi:branched-chain amino acid transport system permease protein
MSTRSFIIAAITVLALGAVAPHVVGNAYFFYAGFVALQYVVIAAAWNILGGYAGFVNFGSGAFVGVGIYAAVFLFNALDAPLWAQILIGT